MFSGCHMPHYLSKTIHRHPLPLSIHTTPRSSLFPRHHRRLSTAMTQHRHTQARAFWRYYNYLHRQSKHTLASLETSSYFFCSEASSFVSFSCLLVARASRLLLSALSLLACRILFLIASNFLLWAAIILIRTGTHLTRSRALKSFPRVQDYTWVHTSLFSNVELPK